MSQLSAIVVSVTSNIWLPSWAGDVSSKRNMAGVTMILSSISNSINIYMSIIYRLLKCHLSHPRMDKEKKL